MDKRIVYMLVFLGLVTIALFSVSSPEPELLLMEKPDRNYTIGIMSATKTGDPYYRYLGELAISEINQYCIDSGLDYRFDVSYACSDGQAQKSQENTQQFHEEGIKLAVGYAWSSQYCAGLNRYGEENGMVLISTGSTSPLGCCRKIDHGFRLYPYDGLQAEPLASSIIDKGYSNLIIFSRSDSWADHIIEYLEPVYTSKGGRIQAVVEYPGATFNESFKLHVKQLYNEFNSSETHETTAILAVSFSEIGGMLTEVAAYPELLNVTWFGTDAIANLDQLSKEEGEITSRVQLISPLVTIHKSSKYNSMNTDFEAKFNVPLSLSLSNIYDGVWLIALSVVEAGSDDADAVVEALPIVAESYIGVSGPIGFDEYGDRLSLDYEYWAVCKEDGEYINKICGYYNQSTRTISWEEDFIEG